VYDSQNRQNQSLAIRSCVTYIYDLGGHILTELREYGFRITQIMVQWIIAHKNRICNVSLLPFFKGFFIT